MSYHYSRTVALKPHSAIMRLYDELARRRLSVLCTIHVHERLGEKLGVEMEPYTILGVCSPSHAHRALGIERGIGLLLPCNITIRVEGTKTIVSALRASEALALTGNPLLAPLAQEIERLLTESVDAIAGGGSSNAR